MMTDEQIIKALEICNNLKLDCLGCAYFHDPHCDETLCVDALSLIKRQKAEIEKLKGLLWNADSTMYALVYGVE